MSRALVRTVTLLFSLGLVYALPGTGATTPAHAATFRYVSPGGTDNFNCSISSSPCKTIGYAESKAVSGDSIEIAGGASYSASVATAKDLTFETNGATAGTATIDGGGQHVFQLNGGSVTFKNVTIQNGSAYAGGGVENSGNGHLTVFHCLFVNNTAVSGGAIYSYGQLTVTNTTFRGNQALGEDAPTLGSAQASGGLGGAIFAYTVVIAGSTFDSNLARGGNGNRVNSLNYYAGPGEGGAINLFNSGTSTIDTSTFVGNVARGGAAGASDPHNVATAGAGQGGAIFRSSTTSLVSVTISHSLFSSNQAIGGEGGSTLTAGPGGAGGSGAGGAIYNDDANSIGLYLANDTLYGNSTTGGAGSRGTFGGAGGSSMGGALEDYQGGVGLENVTLDANTASSGRPGAGNSGPGAPGRGTGGGVHSSSSPIVLRNTILSRDLPDNCAGTTGTSGGAGVNGDASDLQFPLTVCGPTVTVGDPNLGALAPNGGPTETQALVPPSAAIDQGDNSVCSDVLVNDADQRLAPRVPDPQCDIGAYEYKPVAPTAARVSFFSVARRHAVVTLRWRVAHLADIVGFRLFRDGSQLTSRPIAVHSSPSYIYRAVAPPRARFTLRVVLRGGRQVDVARSG